MVTYPLGVQSFCDDFKEAGSNGVCGQNKLYFNYERFLPVFDMKEGQNISRIESHYNVHIIGLITFNNGGICLNKKPCFRVI